MTLDEEIADLTARLKVLRRQRANGNRSSKQIGKPRSDAVRAKIAAGMKLVWAQRQAAGIVSSKPRGKHALSLDSYCSTKHLP